MFCVAACIVQITFMNVFQPAPNVELVHGLEALEATGATTPDVYQKVAWISLAILTVSGRKGLLFDKTCLLLSANSSLREKG